MNQFSLYESTHQALLRGECFTMNIRSTLRRSETLLGLVRDSRKVAQKVKNIIRRRSQSCDGVFFQEYLSTNRVRKLHIGAGDGALSGWLNTDIDPGADDVFFLDATKPFPLNENTFDYVYSEHMIEHISRRDASFMLRECRRVLKPSGTIRIATPDLQVIAGLYAGNGDPDKHRYIKWITDRFMKNTSDYQPGFVINQAFYNWGHQFLYDGELLARDLQDAGFTDIQRRSMGFSEDEHLRGIESHGKFIEDDHIAAFETMILEGKCSK
jgi:predicted SAM-dependent methyltransferase